MRRLGECALLAVLFAAPALIQAADRVNNGEESDPGPLPPLPLIPGGETVPPPAVPVVVPAPVLAPAAPVAVAPSPVSVTTTTTVAAPVAAPVEEAPRHTFNATRVTKEEVVTPGGNEKKEAPKGDLTGDIPLPPPGPKTSTVHENPPVIRTGPIENNPPAPAIPIVAKTALKPLDDGPAVPASKGVALQTSASLIDDQPAVVLPSANETGPGHDLLADRPGTVPEAKRGAFYMEMPDYVTPEWATPEIRKSYRHIAEMKQLIYQISLDLDNGGLETTRLKFNTEALEKSITDVIMLWEDNAKFKDRGLSAKRTALVLEEELGNEPRKWSHVRWAFRELQVQVRGLRQESVDLCAAQPRPIRIIDKNGKETILPPEKDPLMVAREAEAQRLADLKKEKERTKKRSGESAEDPLANKKLNGDSPYLKPRD